MTDNESQRKERYECEHCDYTTDSKRGLGVHEASHDDDPKKKTYTCENCGEQFEDYISRRESRGREEFFCGRDCKDEYQTTETVEADCSWCGSTVEMVPSRANYGERSGSYEISNRFCDKDCESAFKQSNWVGEDHPSWDGGNVELDCEQCGETFDVKPAEADDARFCSVDCVAESQRNLVTATCDECGGEFEDHEYLVERNDGVYCSTECGLEGLSKKRRGENNPAWKGGPVGSYGGRWDAQRRSALERDGFVCQACGKTRAEQIDELGRDLHVHHVKPVRSFSDPNDAHDLDNLVTFCHTCHREQEGKSRSELETVIGSD